MKNCQLQYTDPWASDVPCLCVCDDNDGFVVGTTHFQCNSRSKIALAIQLNSTTSTHYHRTNGSVYIIVSTDFSILKNNKKKEINENAPGTHQYQIDSNNAQKVCISMCMRASVFAVCLNCITNQNKDCHTHLSVFPFVESFFGYHLKCRFFLIFVVALAIGNGYGLWTYRPRCLITTAANTTAATTSTIVVIIITVALLCIAFGVVFLLIVYLIRYR